MHNWAVEHNVAAFQNFPLLYRKYTNSGGFRYISGRGGMRNQAVEHNVAAFLS